MSSKKLVDNNAAKCMDPADQRELTKTLKTHKPEKHDSTTGAKVKPDASSSSGKQRSSNSESSQSGEKTTYNKHNR